MSFTDQPPQDPSGGSFVVCALYRFVKLEDHTSLRQPLLDQMNSLEIKGTVLLAGEGINGTVAGSGSSIAALLSWLQQDARFYDLSTKVSRAETMPFYRTKVKLKKEIVTMGVEGIDPNEVVGTYVEPRDWNELISDPEVLVVDTRNEYEVEIGSFERSINPHTDSFREFPEYVKQHLNVGTHKKVAMYCTGGIRCEKSTAFLKEQGFDEVYHLQGGILKYLEEVPEAESLWRGECFVFDNRVTVNHQLAPGSYDQCNACRMPITDQDQKSIEFEKGVSCPYCFGEHSDKQLERFRQRELQVGLATARGEVHIGGEMAAIADTRKDEKLRAKAASRASEVRKS